MFLLDKERKSAKFHHLKEPCRLREKKREDKAIAWYNLACVAGLAGRPDAAAPCAEDVFGGSLHHPKEGQLDARDPGGC